MFRLFLVRHGLTEWNSSGVYQGQTDVPLSDEGHDQIHALRERLRDEEFTVCFTSTLARAYVSAEDLLEGRLCPIYRTPELCEMSYGEWEGLTRSQIRKQFPHEWARFISDRTNQAAPGGESPSELASRVQRFLARVELEYAMSDASLLVVAHGGSLRVIVASYLNLPLGEARKLRLDNASLSIVEVYRKDAVLSLFNDTAHLGFHKAPLHRQPAH